ncbi:[protein-PII] uridylyltransferase [Janibacter sp. G56]|uniref:[protein-PII] uridylyltransferase n=1 Tax=Janibacter sp. G56 TaxID=3418717 RepID=UPI003D095279
MKRVDSDLDTDLLAARLDLAGTRCFTAAGAGHGRREALSDVTTRWLAQRYAEATQGRRLGGVALAAVGSLGRRESGPLSDLDLVLLHDGRSLPSDEVAALADRIWYPIWDANLKLDHSVRTVGECRQVAGADLTAAVGLLDLAHIAGDEEVVSAARSTVAHDWRANARRRLPELLEKTAYRHSRHGDLAQSIEPDLKEAHGGLRDMTVLRALTSAWLTDRPRGEVDEAYRRLLDVRDALHVVTGRGRDRLGREDHDAVAALLGHEEADDLLTEVSSAARTIAWALDSTTRRASQSQRARTLRVGPRKPRLRILGHGLFEHDGEAVLRSAQLVGTDSLLPLRAAAVAARANLPLAPQTLTNLAASPDLPEPWSDAARDLFADLLAAGPGLVPVWEGLDQVGLIERWIPEWVSVRSRPQRNAVHRHTVDLHLLEAVLEASSLTRDVSRADLLLVAALLHDIGKVRGAHDHSETGAKVAATIVARMGMSQRDQATVTLLVRQHLVLMELATRRDLDDPATMSAVADAVGGDLETFELLRALTIADARATGPKAWTEWRSSLLEQLTVAARARLDATPSDVPDPALSAPAEISPEVFESVATGRPHVTVTAVDGGYSVIVTDRDRLGLFADTAGLLAAYGLTIRRARLQTHDQVAVDEWTVESPGGDPPEPARIVAGLVRLGGGDRSALGSLEKRRAAYGPGTPGWSPSRALVVPRGADDATVLEVRTQDRPGLLHVLGLTFARLGLTVRSAHISTHAGQTLDTFYLQEFGGHTMSPARVAHTVSSVIDACDGVAD